MASDNYTVRRFDGHVQTTIKRGSVDFIFGDGRLLTVSCDKWPFGIGPNDELIRTGGWPLPESPALAEHFPKAKSDNELFYMAEEIAREALAEYRASSDFAADAERHRHDWRTRPVTDEEAALATVVGLLKAQG
jgi:hypothetical protein